MFADLRASRQLICCLMFLGVLPQAGTPPSKSAAAPGAMSGVVLNGATREPAAGAVVSLWPSGSAVSTDSKGRFVFRELAPSDRYELSVTKPGFSAGSLARYGISSGARLSVRSGEWASDIRVMLWPLAAVNGIVVDERGEPIVDAFVRVLTRVPVAGQYFAAAGPMSRTDDRGAYRVAGLRRGRYFVSVLSIQAAIPARRDIVPPALESSGAAAVYASTFYPNSLNLSEALPIELGDGEQRTGVDFRLAPVAGVRVRGRLDGPAPIIGGMPVRLILSESSILGNGGELAATVSAPDGSFELTGVPEGRYLITARKSVTGLRIYGALPGPLPAAPPGLTRGTSRLRLVPTGVHGMETFLDTSYDDVQDDYFGSAEIVVERRNPDDVFVSLQQSGKISGRVIRSDGTVHPQPVSLQVDPADGDPRLGSSATARTDGDGRFLVTGLLPGQYFLRTGSSVLIDSIDAPNGPFTDKPFTVGAAEHIRDVVVRLGGEGGRLLITLRNVDGQPAPGAGVIVFSTAPARWVRFGLEPPWIRTVTCFRDAPCEIARLPLGEYYAVAVSPERRYAWHEPGFLAAAAPLATRIALNSEGVQSTTLAIRDVVVK